jgi:L-alanine-DL-glutamate epimerase-like enolase superfamily enzyme
VAAVVAGALADVVLAREPGDPGLPDALGAAVWGNAAARSAVECAAADLWAQQQGLPLARSLAVNNSGRTTRIRTDMTLSVAAPSALAARAQELVTAGFGCLKLKASAAHDTVAGVRAVRAAVGPGIGLRVDANQAWDADTAIRVIRAAEDEGVGLELVEQPVPALDLDALTAVTAAVHTPIMADESVRTAADVHRVAQRGAADLVNVKLAKTGGLAEAVAAVHAARAAGLGVVIGCMMESSVGVAAAAHLAATLAPDVVHDLDAASWLRRPPVTGGLVLDGDVLDLGTAPGLGITGHAADAVVLVDVARQGVHA